MADTKTRKIFNFTGFRGTDTETAPDQVARFRAIKGKNFYIDSNTLKTRPAFINDKFYNVQGNILGAYFFNDTEIILTDQNFIYFFQDEKVFFTNGITYNTGEKVFTNINNFFFEQSRPFFVQEKDCLFIFCVNDVLVISEVIGEEGSAFVVYPIYNKMSYTFDANFSKYCSQDKYGDLPEAYIPTIQIGDNAFEDVNLLSNKRKYKLFAKADEEKKSTYRLLGDYNPEKNGLFKDISLNIDFYGQNIKEMKQLPTFLGVEGLISEPLDNSTYFWVFPNLSDTPNINVQTIGAIVQSKEIWEYRDDDINFEDPIFFDTGLTKEEALTLVLPNKKTVFEFLRDFDFTDFEDIIAGRTVIYKIKVTFEYRYKVLNANGIRVRAGKKKTEEKEVYFKVNFFETEKNFIYSGHLQKGSVETTGSDEFPNNYIFPIPIQSHKMYNDEYDDFIDLPATGDINTAYYISSEKSFYNWSAAAGVYFKVDDFLYDEEIFEPALDGKITNKQIEKVVDWFNKNYIDLLPLNVADAEEAFVKVMFTKSNYTPAIKGISQTISFPSPSPISTGLKASSLYTNMQTMQNSTFPTLAVPPHPSGQPIHYITINFYTIGDLKYDPDDMYQALEECIYDDLEQYANANYLSAGSYRAVISLNEFKMAGIGIPTFVNGKKYSFYFDFDVVDVVAESTTYEHFGYIVPIYSRIVALKELYELKLVDDLLEITFSNDLINYKNEPAINLEIIFPKNDYNANLIKKMKFGTTFGSEYRIFLAGNPEFAHIDRYNISNDLLGDNVKSQSYEASYFPSKSYRVVGGKNSAINGYVVANDTQLYVTKKYAVNDSCLFIRNRVMNEDGKVSYFEYKTNIKSPPVNEKCLVNFYNDVVMLTENGLQGIEISSNILTNERLLKLRSGFINTELKKKIKEAYNVALFEDDERLFIILDNNIYVADARYAEENPNSQVGNVSYEMVRWEVAPFIKNAILHNGNLRFYDDARSYILKDCGLDKTIKHIGAGEIIFNNNATAWVDTTILDDFDDMQMLFFKQTGFSDVYAEIFNNDEKNFVESGESLSISEEFVEEYELRTGQNVLEEGFFWSDGINLYHVFPTLNDTLYLQFFKCIYFKINNKSLYVIKEDDNIILKVTKRSGYFSRIFHTAVDFFEDFMLLYEKEKPVEVEWFSGALDLGEKLYEKTMFEITFYVRRLERANILKYGYRTLRGYKEFSNLEDVDLANSISFEEQNYNLFAVTTFENVAITRKQKENNFLYIQFMFKGEGNIEIGDIIVYYKSNRKIKSVG